MGVWRKTKTGPNPNKKKRKNQRRDFSKENHADVAVSPHKPYTDLMVGKDAENFDPNERMNSAKERVFSPEMKERVRKLEEDADLVEKFVGFLEMASGGQELDFDTWLQIGYENGWCGAPVCYTHDGLPTTEQEDAEFEEGDPCISVIRLYWDEDEKRGVEENHSPSQWRASNRGL